MNPIDLNLEPPILAVSIMIIDSINMSVDLIYQHIFIDSHRRSDILSNKKKTTITDKQFPE